jgi:hypothetical protein
MHHKLGKDGLSSFSDVEYKRLKSADYRKWSSRLYPIAFLARILEKSLDVMIINIRDKNPNLYYLQALENSFYKRVQIEGNIRKFDTHQSSDFNFTKIVEDFCLRRSLLFLTRL